jgi:NO-binding membrane sensor protein with MHYT domain
MGHLHHFEYGALTPMLAYAMACVGAGLGLRCTVRAIEATGSSRWRWLLTGAAAIGSGIWTMHFIAMLGFGVDGTPVRYDGWLTVASLLVAVFVVSAGVFTVGYSRFRLLALAVGGAGTGLGVAAMHYLGMSAVRLHGVTSYDLTLVILSVAIAVTAATAALWAAFRVRGVPGTVIAALVMGVAVSAMHYTGMAALRIDVVPDSAPLPGLSAVDSIFPLIVVLGSFLFLSSAFVALSPTAKNQAAAATAERLRATEIPAH